jgi:hypothetical protein
MKNAEMAVEGNILTIKVDLAKDFGHRRRRRALSSPQPRAMSPSLTGRRRWV